MSQTVDADQEFETLLEYLREERGFDFTGYKRRSLMRRVRRRMSQNGAESFIDELQRLEANPEEFAHLFDTVLINVTGFFRDPEAWDYLAREVIPRIVGPQGSSEPIRVWCAGCASGEEAYTVTMLLAEALGLVEVVGRLKVYATDVDENALAAARHARYPRKALAPLGGELVDRYFEGDGSSAVFRHDMRRLVIFGRHDLVRHPPISRLDLIVCRNVLMYFQATVQERIVQNFHFALKNSGFLFLGKAEMLLSHARLFAFSSMKHRVFTKVPGSRHLTAWSDEAAPDAPPSNPADLRGAAFEASPVAQIVIDVEGRLHAVNGQARGLFGLGFQDRGRLFSDLVLSYRPLELRSLIEEALAQGRTVKRHGIERRLPDEELQVLDVEVIPLLDHDEVLGSTVTFVDVSDHAELSHGLEDANTRLATAMEELQSTNEELETTNEELQSTNEELETTNEELQSTNEELETMNEELQSTNEELQTLNDEIGQRGIELDEARLFLESILASVQQAVIVLDRNLCVRLWNTAAQEQWGWRVDEVIGKPLLELDMGLPVEGLADPIRQLLAGAGQPPEQAVQAVNRLGKRVECRVSCAPVGSGDGAPRGVLIMIDTHPNE